MEPIRTTPKPTVRRVMTQRYYRAGRMGMNDSHPLQPSGIRYSRVAIRDQPVDFTHPDQHDSPYRGIVVTMQECDWEQGLETTCVEHILSKADAIALATALLAQAAELTD